MKELTVFAFSDYRNYLKKYFLLMKKEKPYFSHRYFCKIAGFKTSSVIKLVIDRKRNLSRTSIIKVGRAMNLSAREYEYFETLVLFNQAKEPDEKREMLLKLSELKGTASPALVEKKNHDFYKEWHHTVVRECLGIEGLPPNPEFLSKKIRPNISPRKIRESINLMLQLGMITKNKKGTYGLADQAITTEDELDSEYVAAFNREMINLALKASLIYPSQEREISGVTLRISNKCYKEMKKKITQFKKELLYMATQDEDSDCIYQLNFQLFPFFLDK